MVETVAISHFLHCKTFEFFNKKIIRIIALLQALAVIIKRAREPDKKLSDIVMDFNF